MTAQSPEAIPGQGVPNNPQPSNNPETQSPAPPPAPSSPAPTPASTPPAQNNEQLLATVNALPERIVSAMREALTPPKPAAPAAAPPAATPAGQPGKKSFVEWWFGK